MKKLFVVSLMTLSLVTLSGCSLRQIGSTISIGSEVSTEVIEETEKIEINTAYLEGVVKDFLSNSNNSPIHISYYMDKVNSSSKMLELSSNNDRSLIYVSIPMFGFGEMYKDMNSNLLYYNNGSDWYSSEDVNNSTEGFDYESYINSSLDKINIFDSAISSNYIKDKFINGKDCYVLELKTSDPSKEVSFNEVDGTYSIPTPDGVIFYLSEGESNMYKDTEYTVIDGVVYANGEHYIPESGELTYNMYITKDDLKFYAFEYSDKYYSSSLFITVSNDDLEIPDVALNSDSGNYEEYSSNIKNTMLSLLGDIIEVKVSSDSEEGTNY